MQLVLDTNGVKLNVRNKAFLISHKRLVKRIISPKKISSINILCEAVISTAAMKLATTHQIPLLICNNAGKVEATIASEKYTGSAAIRKNQIRIQQDIAATDIAIYLCIAKVKLQNSLLQKLCGTHDAPNIDQAVMKLEDCQNMLIADCRQTMMGIEGSISRHYWQKIADHHRDTPWQFSHRSRQPAKDKYNALINYAYGMAYNMTEHALRGVGLDPYVGILHVDGYNAKALTYDMIEIIRPLIDNIVCDFVTIENPKAKWYYPNKKGVWLSKEGRKIMIDLYHEKVDVPSDLLDTAATIKTYLYNETYKLAQNIKNYDKQ